MTRRARWVIVRTVRAVRSVLVGFVLSVAAGARTTAGAQGSTGIGWGRGSLVLLDELEYSLGQAGRPIAVDGLAWVGGAYNRLWVRTDGEQRTDGGGGAGDAELFYGRLISPYWDALVGARVDGRWGEGDSRARGYLALGLQGLAPMRFELAPTLYVSAKGDVAARLEGSYQLLVTQRVILEPEATLNAAAQPSPEFARAPGLTDVAVTTRVRYEIRREFAPYVGVSWFRRTGGTAELARAAGEPVSDWALVFGLRAWR